MSRNDCAWENHTFPTWRSAVNVKLKKVYAITINDAGIEDDLLKAHWETKQSPLEFVEWFGIKYDLRSVEALGIKGFGV
jgi:hypothetical protein